jgi:hypothetical protein
MGDDTSGAGDLADLAALADLAGGRVDAVHACPETGLIAIVVYAGEKKKQILGVGIGPDVAGVGWLPRLPRIRAGVSHPLIAAMRAHLLGHRVRGAGAGDDGSLWIAVAGPEGGEARAELLPGRRGEARVFAASGALVMRWPPPEKNTKEASDSKASSEAESPRVLEPIAIKMVPGERLVDESDKRSAARAKTALARSIKTRLSALERRAEAIAGDLARLSEIDKLQKIGRLLLAQGSKIPRGASSASLQDWETGGAIDVPLDPATPAKSQAERFFAKARRYQRGEVIMRRRLAEAERSVADLRALAAEIDAALPDAAALEAIAQKARGLGVSGAPAPATTTSARSSKPAERKPFHTFLGANDRPILVGRGGADNDALTTKHARPHDLWLHAKGVTGAHVVVPLEKNSSCPPDLLVDAATLAAHFSDARGEAVCDVTYVERRHVRKPRKSAPGAVTFDREKVMAVRVEPARLERLLATKEGA